MQLELNDSVAKPLAENATPVTLIASSLSKKPIKVEIEEESKGDDKMLE